MLFGIELLGCYLRVRILGVVSFNVLCLELGCTRVISWLRLGLMLLNVSCLELGYLGSIFELRL